MCLDSVFESVVLSFNFIIIIKELFLYIFIIIVANHLAYFSSLKEAF